MPRKTRAHVPIDSLTPNQDPCHHENLHWVGEGELRCELPKGHAGNHQADYVRSDGVTARGEWTDMAGTPIVEFERDIPAQIQRRMEVAIENQKQAAAEMENQVRSVRTEG